MEPWITHGLAALVGAMLGGAGVFAWRSTGGRGGDARAAREELEAYREKVARHFADTAHQINDLTERYQAVFEQLQTGADQLVDADTLRQLLGEQDGQTITLPRLGYRGRADQAGQESTDDDSVSAPMDAVADPEESSDDESESSESDRPGEER